MKNISEWILLLKEAKEKLNILNAESANKFINELQQVAGIINEQMQLDLRERDDSVRLLFQLIENKPNERQFAVA